MERICHRTLIRIDVHCVMLVPVSSVVPDCENTTRPDPNFEIEIHVVHTPYFSLSSLETGALRMTRRSLEGAWKCALRDLLREEAIPVGETISISKLKIGESSYRQGVSSSGKSNWRKTECEIVRTVGSDSHLKGRGWEVNGCRWRWSKRGSFLMLPNIPSCGSRIVCLLISR